MMPIKRLSATITAFKDLSPTAREVTLTLSETMPFIAGSFVNVFMEHEGEVLRRAFSISSFDSNFNEINLSIRLNPEGAMTPLFWKEDIVGTKVDLMGPLGLNTADKMQKDKIFLFGFGVGAGVMKSLAEYFAKKDNISTLTIVTGSRTELEILHKDFFDTLQAEYVPVTVKYVVSKPENNSPHKSGYIQEHINDLDFNNSDIYVCGQEAVCDYLVERVKDLDPKECTYFIEGFH